MNLFVLLRSLLSYFGILIVATICFFPCAIIALLPEKYRYNSRVFYWFSDAFYKSVLTFLFLPIEVKGIENLPGDRPVIFAGNHQSALDIPIMGSLCNGYPHIWLVLSYYLKSPFLGFFVRRMNIPVNPHNPRQSARALSEAIKFIKGKNRHLVIFPEGRRITEAKVSNFMKGIAVVAKRTGHPVLPVYMPNNGKVYPPNSFLIYNYPIKIIIGELLYYKENDTDEIFIKKVHEWFVNQDLQ